MLRLHGVNMPDFVKVESVEFPLLPPIENQALQVRGRKGLFLYDQQTGKREIKVNVFLIAQPYQVMQKARELAEWFYHDDEVKLVFEDEADKFYIVVPDGNTDFTEMGSVGTGTLTFLCVDPYAYSIERRTHNVKPTSTTPFYMTVDGTAPTFPDVELTLNEDIDSIAVVTDDEYVMIGEPAEATKTKVNRFPTRLHDYMENVLAWTPGNQVDNGTISGTLSSTNMYGVTQTGKNYGSNANGWHGAAMIRSLPTPIQDFQAAMRFTMAPGDFSEMGRIELYLLDVNGEHIGKVGLSEVTSNADHPTFYARTGDANEGTSFDSYKGGKTVYAKIYKKIDRKMAEYLAKYSTLSGMYGQMYIQRRGTKWTAFIGRYDDNGKKFITTHTATWTDKKGRWKAKLAGVQIHIGAYKGYKAQNLMQISDVYVKEYVELSKDQTPIIAEKGDVLLIDCENSIIYKNGHEFYEALVPGSEFFSFEKGVRGLAVTVPNTNVEVTFRERWL